MDSEDVAHVARLPVDRSDQDVCAIRIETERGEIIYDGRRKDLEFDLDEDEFAFDEKWVELWE